MKRILSSLLALSVIMVPAFAQTADDDPLLAKIVDFAKANMGKTVGNGECAGLAAQALKAAGAKPRARVGYPAANDYVWGEEVLLIEAAPDGVKMTGTFEDVKPGYIVQFSNVKFQRAHFAHHTAIVESINRKRLGLLQQHIGGHRFVVEGAVRIDKLASGWMRFYRPLPL